MSLTFNMSHIDFQQETKIKGTLKLINFHEFEAWTNKLVVIGDFVDGLLNSTGCCNRANVNEKKEAETQYNTNPPITRNQY